MTLVPVSFPDLRHLGHPLYEVYGGIFRLGSPPSGPNPTPVVVSRLDYTRGPGLYGHLRTGCDPQGPGGTFTAPTPDDYRPTPPQPYRGSQGEVEEERGSDGGGRDLEEGRPPPSPLPLCHPQVLQVVGRAPVCLRQDGVETDVEGVEFPDHVVVEDHVPAEPRLHRGVAEQTQAADVPTDAP